MREPLAILYQNERLVAIDKPAGLLVHRSNIDRHETEFAVQRLRDQLGRKVYPVHRLDKGTSGVLLFALAAEHAASLSAQFEKNQVEKIYQALVRGWPNEQGEIDHPLTREVDPYDTVSCRESAQGQAYAQSYAEAPAQAASTRYRTLARFELPYRVDRYARSRYALVELRPLTGRRHQLRRHLKHISHPIIGDSTHGKGQHNRFFQAQFGCHRMLLACVSLRFREPLSQRECFIQSPLRGQFAETVSKLTAESAAFPLR